MSVGRALLLAAGTLVLGFLAGLQLARSFPASPSPSEPDRRPPRRPPTGPAAERDRRAPEAHPRSRDEAARGGPAEPAGDGALPEGEGEQASGAPLDQVPWSRHLETFRRLSRLSPGGTGPAIETDTALMRDLAAFMADLGPAFRATKAASVEELMRRPGVHARILAAALAEETGDGASDGIRRRLLDLLPSALPPLGDPRSLAESARVDLSCYLAARSETPAGTLGALDEIARSVFFFSNGAVRHPQGALATPTALLRTWKKLNRVSTPAEDDPDALRVTSEWLRRGRRAVELLDGRFDGLASVAALSPRELPEDPSARTVELRLRLRLSFAELQAEMEERLLPLLSPADASALAKRTDLPLLIVMEGN